MKYDVGSGQLSEKELKSALVNGDWTSFDSHTVRMMIRYEGELLEALLKLNTVVHLELICCMLYKTGCLTLIEMEQLGLMNSGKMMMHVFLFFCVQGIGRDRKV